MPHCRRLLAVLPWLLAGLRAQDGPPKEVVTPELQVAITAWQQKVAALAAEPALVAAVQAQNAAGPIAGLDNPKWKTWRRRSPEVIAFQESVAGKRLGAWLRASSGVAIEAFLNGSKGEKVAFAEKTSSYLHAGMAKFDAPFTTGKPWQGLPEFDESTQTYALQVAVPVLAPAPKPDAPASVIGVLVVGLDLEALVASLPPPVPGK